MGFGIYFFAGRQDNRKLCDFATSLGLIMLPILNDRPQIMPDDDPASGPCCFLSPLPRAELHPYGKPAGIGDATDPLIEFLRSYSCRPNCLVMGRVCCSDDVRAFVPITKPYFSKIANWIRREWVKLPAGHQYIGPEALSLAENGTKLLQLPPSVKVRQLHVGGARQSDRDYDN